MPSRPLLAGALLVLLAAPGRAAEAPDLPDVSAPLELKAQARELAARHERQRRLDAAWAQVIAPTILATWRESLPRADATAVRFEDAGPGKVGIYDRKTKALVFNQWFFRELVECFAATGAVDAREGARAAAEKTLPLLAHLLRKKRLSEARAAEGLGGPEGFLEDEVLYDQDEAAALRKVMTEEPALFKDPRYRPILDGIDLDGRYAELLQAADAGHAALAAFARSGQPGMRSLLWEAPPSQDPATLVPLKVFYREQLEEAGIPPDALKPAAR